MFLLFALYACFVHPIGYGYGRASFYGAEQPKRNHHRPMANGRPFRPEALTAASYEFPLGTVVEVTNLANGRRVVVTVTDRGPARKLGRLIDLSEGAARVIDARRAGIADVAIMVRRYA